MNEINAVVVKISERVEVLWVDDCSTDGTAVQLCRIVAGYPYVRAMKLDSHLGQAAALWLGLRNARGEVIVTLDGDLQISPEDIPKLLTQLECYDMVIGYRKVRKDSLPKRLFSLASNFLRNCITHSSIPDSGCSLRAFRREWIEELVPFVGLHRFLPTIVELRGGKVAVVPVVHRDRAFGHSKYGMLDRAVSGCLDCLMIVWLMNRGFPKGYLSCATKLNEHHGA